MPVAILSKRDFKPLPSEGVAALMQRKLPMGSDAFDTLVAEQRAQAFRIAGINKASLIRRAQAELAKGLRDGASLQDIRLRLLNIFEDEGVQAPGLNHLRTIMRQNMLGVSSIARTRTLRHPAVVQAFPWWEYVTVQDSGVRPTHAALHGRIFRADDPFWDSYDPPWEWGCRCSKIPVSRRRLKQMGIEPDEVATLADVTAEGIAPNPEFDFPRDQLGAINRVVLASFTGELRKWLDERLSEADKIERDLIRRRS